MFKKLGALFTAAVLLLAPVVAMAQGSSGGSTNWSSPGAIGAVAPNSAVFTTATITQPSSQANQLTFNHFGNSDTHIFAYNSNNEFYLINNQAGLNSLVLRNQNSSGYPALVTDGLDIAFPSTNMNPAGYYQHATFGYGPGLTLNGFTGLGYIESARYNAQNNAYIWPLTFTIQQTGGAMQTAVSYNLVVTQNTNTVTINGGGNFPASCTGWIIRERGDGGFFTPGTTITGGCGTATLTLSNNSLATNGFVQTLMGAPTYGQYNAMVFRDLKGIDIYPWSTGTTATAPFVTFNRNFSSVGMGAISNSFLPNTALDVVGAITVGFDASQRSSFSGSLYGLNIDQTTANFMAWLHPTDNTLHVNWNGTGATSRIDWLDVNHSIIGLTSYMDGSGAVGASTLRLTNGSTGPTIAAGAVAPITTTFNGVTGALSGTPVAGSMYTNTAGALGARVYWYYGGAWVALAAI